MSKQEKYIHGRKEGVKENQGRMNRKGTHKTIEQGGHCDGGGGTDTARAASSIYQKAVRNGGGSGDIGDKAVKTR